MKMWLFMLTAFLSISAIAIILSNLPNPSPLSQPPSTSPIIPAPSVKKQSVIIDVEGVPTRVSWTQVKPEDVEFYSNLQASQSSKVIKLEKNCKILVNGGFYSKENTHLGLVISKFEILSTPLQSLLFNGFLWVGSKEAVISSSPPAVTPRLAIQSGPLLMQDGASLPLTIENDQPDRRIIAATTGNNSLLFLALYHDKSPFQGPLLAQAPKIIDSFANQLNIDIVNAINLDGGSASVFITEFESLPEMAQIGSYFCSK